MNDIILFLLDKVVLSVFIGVIASGVFFVILSRFKPKLEISPEIAKGKMFFLLKNWPTFLKTFDPLL